MKTINLKHGSVNPYFTPQDPALKVGDTFMHNGRGYLLVNDEQGTSFERVVRRQGRENYVEAYYDHLDGYLAVLFKDIFIGIEPDGYAHS